MDWTEWTTGQFIIYTVLLVLCAGGLGGSILGYIMRMRCEQWIREKAGTPELYVTKKGDCFFTIPMGSKTERKQFDSAIRYTIKLHRVRKKKAPATTAEDVTL